MDLFDLESRAAELSGLNLGTKEEPRQLGDKTAQRILKGIEAARSAPLAKWLVAIGIPGIGEEGAIELAKYHDEISAIKDSRTLRLSLELRRLVTDAKEANPLATKNRPGNLEEWNARAQKQQSLNSEIEACAKHLQDAGVEIQIQRRHRAKLPQIPMLDVSGGIAPELAKNALDFFSSSAGDQLLSRLSKLKIKPIGNPTSAKHADPGPLSGKSFVLTGTLESMTRQEATERIRAQGGDVGSDVSRNTTYLVVGADAGSKLEKAKKLGVGTLDESSFRQLIGLGSPTPTRSIRPSQGSLGI